MRAAPEVVETPRLLLRRPQAGDADAIFARYASDPEVTRLIGWPRHETVDATRAFVSFSDAEWARWSAGPYLIFSREGRALLGGTGVLFETPYRAATGYVLAKDAWGRGWQSVVEVRRRTEGGDAPGWQGATTEKYREYLREEQRRQAGCSAGRMQADFHHGLLCDRSPRRHGRRRARGGRTAALCDLPQRASPVGASARKVRVFPRRAVARLCRVPEPRADRAEGRPLLRDPPLKTGLVQRGGNVHNRRSQYGRPERASFTRRRHGKESSE